MRDKSANQNLSRARLQELCELHYNEILRKVLPVAEDRWLAEEATQEAFARALAKADSLECEESFAAWVLRIAVNVVKDRWVQWAREIPTEPGHFSRLAQALGASPEHMVAAGEELNLLAAGVKSLSLKLREVVTLFYIHDLTIRKTAQLLGIPEGTVKSRLFRARTRLKEYLQARR
jgi:RNA polymerase sigma-70 factor (ECF subfamily)